MDGKEDVEYFKCKKNLPNKYILRKSALIIKRRYSRKLYKHVGYRHVRRPPPSPLALLADLPACPVDHRKHTQIGRINPIRKSLSTKLVNLYIL